METTLSGGDGMPVMFIHGLWLHPSSWKAWEELFQANGYRTVAPGWPGVPESVEAARADPGALADKGIDEVVEHYTKIINELPEPPVLIGHSFGGMVAEKLLGMGYGIAAVAIDAPQIAGRLPVSISSLQATLPDLDQHTAVSLTPAQFHLGFANAVGQAESDKLHSMWVMPAPGRPLFEVATANFSPHTPTDPRTGSDGHRPLLLVTGAKQPEGMETEGRPQFKQYRGADAATELIDFPDRGHSLTIDSGWRDVADACLTWLGDQFSARR